MSGLSSVGSGLSAQLPIGKYHLADVEASHEAYPVMEQKEVAHCDGIKNKDSQMVLVKRIGVAAADAQTIMLVAFFQMPPYTFRLCGSWKFPDSGFQCAIPSVVVDV
ncbi:hypothetical protein AKJ16_DCAP17381 [Drosera capensis]